MTAHKLAKGRKSSVLRVIEGLELAMVNLGEVKRIQSLKMGREEKITRIGAVVQTLREKGREAHLPLLSGLAEALEDALIAATD
jgi:hypothetical protein